MKILVETTGEFQLVDPNTMELIPYNRPAVVTSSSFVESRAASGEVKVHFPVTDAATDEEFVAYWKEASDIAVEAFKSEFGPDVEAKKTKAQLKADAEAEAKVKAEQAKADKITAEKAEKAKK